MAAGAEATSMPDLPAPPEAEHAAEVVEQVKQVPAETKKAVVLDQKLLMSEVQMLLAEKRTAYALLRTGVTVSLVPLSIWTVLVATSRLYNVFDILWLLVPVMVLACGLFLLGMWLVYHALAHVRHIENVMLGLRKSDTLLETLLFRDPGFRYLPSFRALRRFRRTKGAS